MGCSGRHVALAPGPRDQALWQVYPGTKRGREPGIAADQQGETPSAAEPGEGFGEMSSVRRIVVAQQHGRACRQVRRGGERIAEALAIDDEDQRRQAAPVARIESPSPVCYGHAQHTRA